ncbi:MAG TPA: NosD domain-containing protein [Terriglobales bacterium]|nr:NosD domain-containing protein [Terriglobales bacterium]
MHVARWILASGLIVAASPLFAQTVAVGNCQPKKTSFPTIQQALNATPPGATIDVCPGPHPEQILVYQAVTLKGIASGNQGAAIITVPSGGLQQNATSLATGNPIAAQVLVQGASCVTITNITVDGANNRINGCGPDPIGIYYQNSSGTISHDTILNEVLGAGLTSCQAGLGIFAQSGNGGSSTVTVTNNHVANYQKNGITGNEVGTSVTITANDVVGQGATNGAAENSIQIGFGATGSITSNTVGSDVWAPDVFGDTGDAAAGILVYASPNVAVKSNNVSNTQYGIAIVSDPTSGAADGATVTSNTVSLTHLYDGIDLCSNTNTATGNTINGSDESAIHLDDTCTGASTGNTVTSNKINSACAGILSGPAATGTITSNTFYNAVTLQETGSNTCTPPPGLPNKTAARSHARIRAARP